jgi:hypothetical protein
MNIEIKNRWSNAVIFSHEQEENTLANTFYMALAAQAVLSNADLSNANLRGADLSNANLRGVDLQGADLSNANLSNADLRGANLSNTNLRGADLRNANLKSADLSDAYLRGADLRGADLSNANLRDANLRDADLRGATLRGADLQGADLRDADLTVIRDDIWAVLSSSPREVPALIDALKNGRVDGSTYEGSCSCLVGTIATARGVSFKEIDSLNPNSYRPAERFFLGISKGDTPETNQASALAHQWASEWLATMLAAFSPDK